MILTSRLNRTLKKVKKNADRNDSTNKKTESASNYQIIFLLFLLEQAVGTFVLLCYLGNSTNPFRPPGFLDIRLFLGTYSLSLNNHLLFRIPKLILNKILKFPSSRVISHFLTNQQQQEQKNDASQISS